MNHETMIILQLPFKGLTFSRLLPRRPSNLRSCHYDNMFDYILEHDLCHRHRIILLLIHY